MALCDRQTTPLSVWEHVDDAHTKFESIAPTRIRFVLVSNLRAERGLGSVGRRVEEVVLAQTS